MLWLKPGPRLSCSVKGPTQFTRHGRRAGRAAQLAVINRCRLCKRYLGVLPLHTALVVGCVISSLLQHVTCCFGVQHFPEMRYSPEATHRGRIPAVVLRMAKVLVAVALQRVFPSEVHLQ